MRLTTAIVVRVRDVNDDSLHATAAFRDGDLSIDKVAEMFTSVYGEVPFSVLERVMSDFKRNEYAEFDGVVITIEREAL